jgi:hypothetical protein
MSGGVETRLGKWRAAASWRVLAGSPIAVVSLPRGTEAPVFRRDSFSFLAVEPRARNAPINGVAVQDSKIQQSINTDIPTPLNNLKSKRIKRMMVCF